MSAAAIEFDLDEPFQVDMEIAGRRAKRLISIRQLYELAKSREHQIAQRMLQDFPDLESQPNAQ
jgi:hypothetical protein